MMSAWALMVMLALPLSSVSGEPRGEQRVAVVELEDNARLGSGVANALTDSVSKSQNDLWSLSLALPQSVLKQIEKHLRRRHISVFTQHTID